MSDLPDALRAWFPDGDDDIAAQNVTAAPDTDRATFGDRSQRDGTAVARGTDRDTGALRDDDGPSSTKRALVVIGVAALLLWAAVVVVAEVAAPAAPARETTPVPADTAAAATAQTDTVHAVAAAAVLAVHDTVAGDRRWVDAAAVDQVTRLRMPDGAEVPSDVEDSLAPGEPQRAVFVVAVQASLLEGDGTAWEVRRRARYAVPVWCSERRCVEAADPWPLPAGTRPVDDSPAPPSRSPTGGTATSDGHTAALSAAGYRQIDVRDTRTLWPGATAVHVRARAPGESALRDFVIWVTAPGDDASARDRDAATGLRRVLGAGDDSGP